MNPNHDDITRALIEAMREEVRHAMTTTNTPEELEKFRNTIEERKRHRSYLTVAAGVVAIAGVGTAIAVSRSGGTTHPEQTTIPAASQLATPTVTPSVAAPTASPVDAPSALPAGIPTAKVDGPGVLGVFAFGSVWGLQNAKFRIERSPVSDRPGRAEDRVEHSLPRP